MNQIYYFKFDFDYWASLNKENPELFEHERRKLIDEHIKHYRYSAKRMRGIQFKIDIERQRSKCPLGACIRLSNLMMNHFHDEFISAVNELDNLKEKID